MKLMPASRALATMRDEVASSVGPPNIMVPRQIGDTFRPLRPRLRYCICCSLTWLAQRIASLRTQAKQSRATNRDVWIASSLALLAMTPVALLAPQNLEHAARHGDAALIDRDLGRDEDQAP